MIATNHVNANSSDDLMWRCHGLTPTGDKVFPFEFELQRKIKSAMGAWSSQVPGSSVLAAIQLLLTHEAYNIGWESTTLWNEKISNLSDIRTYK